MTAGLKRWLINAAAFAVLVGADQAVKIWVRAAMAPGSRRDLIPHVLGLRHAVNDGGAFGILSGWQPFLTVVSVLAIGGFLWFGRPMLQSTFWLPRAALVLVLSGAAGNLIDRLLFGEVTDMFEFLFIRFAIFNVADAFLTVGVVMLVIYLLLFKEDTARSSRDV